MFGTHHRNLKHKDMASRIFLSILLSVTLPGVQVYSQEIINVTFSITDEGGRGIEGATVRINSHNGIPVYRTGSEGKVEIRIQEKGFIVYQVSAAGYKLEKVIQPFDKDYPQISVQLVKAPNVWGENQDSQGEGNVTDTTISIIGRVVNSREKGIAGAGVNLMIRETFLQMETNQIGWFRFDLPKSLIRQAEDINLIIEHQDGSQIQRHLSVHQRILDNSLVNWSLITIPSPVRLVSWKEYLARHPAITSGGGGGINFRKGYSIELINIPSQIRTGRPHPDDKANRPYHILPDDVPDSYLIAANRVEMTLPDKYGVNVGVLNFKGFLSLGLRFLPELVKFEIINDNQLYETTYRKDYIKPGIPGKAFIYYNVKTAGPGVNISIPLSATLPVFSFGKEYQNTFRIVAGTSLFPSAVRLEAEKGWERFGELEVDRENPIGEIGKIKESEWFAGFDMDGTRLQAGLQFGLVVSQLKSSLPILLQDEKKTSFLAQFRIAYLFNHQKFNP